MKIKINGKVEEVEAVTIEQLISDLGQPVNQIVIDYNGAVVKREDWATKVLTEGASLEILKFVGGG